MRTAQKCPTCGADLTLDDTGGHCLRCLWQLAMTADDPLSAPGPDAPHLEQAGDRISRYQLLQQIGEGGCGVVYMAEQEEPVRRRVALKLIKVGMDTKSVIARFEAERQAMALMDHPNIAKVLDAGATDSGRPFFVMELVHGVKITAFCDQQNLSTRERLRLFVRVCNAIQHAHQKGVIHRDIKPSNILVTLNDGVPMPKVIDFGIAKATQQRLTDQTLFTAFAQFIGTPAYMSPEQAELNASGVDTRSDIYSLGVLLYELLTGQTPFAGKTTLEAGFDEIRRLIRETEPTRPSTRLSAMLAGELAAAALHRRTEAPKLIHQVRGDLDWIVLKAMEKDRARRYETANGLALDVQRHLEDEPVVARPPGNLYRFKKLVRRNKLAFAAATAVAAALVIGLAIATWQFLEKSRAEREQNRLRQEAQQAQADEAILRRQAQAQELTARRKAYASSMNLLQQALQEDNLGRAVELLNQQRPTPGQEDLRGWEWRYLWQFCRSDAATTVCTLSNLITSVSLSGDGAWLALATETGEATVWDTASGRLIFRSGDSCHCHARLAFAPGNDLLAYQVQTNLIIWNASSGTEVRRLPIATVMRDLAFLSDSRLMTVENSGTNKITVWDLGTGLAVTNFTAQIYPYGVGSRFAASDDGRKIGYAISHKEVRVVDLAPGTGEWNFPATEEQVTALAFSPDGTILATGAGFTDNAVKLWNTQTRRYVGQLEGHRGWVACLKFLPDGTLASASADQTIRLWDVAARRPLRTLRGHRSDVRALDVSRDGRTLASSSKDGTVLLWDLAAMTARPPGWHTVDPTNQPGIIRAFQFSPDSRIIAAVENDVVKLYDSATLRQIQAPDLGFYLSLNTARLLFSPDSRSLVAAGMDGHVGVWDVPGRRLVTNFVAHVGKANLLGSSTFRGGNSVLTGGSDNIGREWNVRTWQETAHWPLQEEAVPIDFVFSASSPKGLLAMKSGFDRTIQIFPVDDPTRRRQLSCLSIVVGIAFSPDDNTIAAVSEDGTLALWDTRTLASTGILRGVLLGLHSVAFSPDGRRIVAGSNGKEAIKLWDFDSRENVATLEGKGSIFHGVCFSPDGNMIAANNLNGMLHVWRAPSWEEINATEQARQAAP